MERRLTTRPFTSTRLSTGTSTGLSASDRLRAGSFDKAQGRRQAPLAVPVQESDLLAAFAEFLRLDVAQGDASPETVRTYWSNVRQYLNWCAGEGVHPALALEEDLKGYRAHLVEAGYKRTTMATKLAVVRRFYQMAQARGYRADDPSRGLKAPQEHTDRAERVKWLPLLAVKRLLDAPDGETPKGKRDRVIVALMALHGLRAVEVHRLGVGDVDLNAGRITVLGKGKRTRNVFLVEKTTVYLRDWLAVRGAVAAQGEQALFVNVHWGGYGGKAGVAGRRMSRRGVRAAVDGYLEKLGLKAAGVSCHALRHTFATLSKAAGADLLAISHALGHSSVTTTQVYADIVDKATNNPTRFLVGALDLVASE